MAISWEDRLFRLSMSLLDAIEDARLVSECCNGVSRLAILIIKICNNNYYGEAGIREIHLNKLQFHLYIDEIESCLKSCIIIARNVASRTENYFGVFEESLYRVELISVVSYLQLIIDRIMNHEVDYNDGFDKLHEMARSPTMLLFRSVVSKLFWLRQFRAETVVSWDDFRNCFINNYGIHQENNLKMLKAHLVKEENRVGIYTFIKFVSNYSGPYEAFQVTCDPGTVVYCAGIVDDSVDRSYTALQIIPSLLGLHIIQVACGGQHAAILTSEGHVYTWGKGGFGRLGHGSVRPSEIPVLVDTLRNTDTVQVACGFAYTAVVTRTGQVYTWGAGENGRLGLGDVTDKLFPCRVTSLMDSRITGVFAGSVHTCMLTDRGEVLVCGKYEYTGHGELEDILTPKPLPAFYNITIKQISVGKGGYHTIALTAKGEVYVWGHNRVGQLGYLNTDEVPRNLEGAHFLPTPRMLPGFGRDHPDNIVVSQVVAGWGHTSLVTEDGRVMMCGRNVQGQLGLGDPATFPTNERNHAFQPQFAIVTSIQHKRVVTVACGGEHSVMLCDDNDLYTVGAATRGQLGQDGEESCFIPKLALPFRREGRDLLAVACGNNCTLVLAGRHQPIPLLRSCAETIKMSATLQEHMMSSSSAVLSLLDYVMQQEC